MQDIHELIDLFIENFLGRPYLYEPLGEGSDGTYSTRPLYRFDAFDCVTFVDTILALVSANNMDDFKKKFLAIRYQNSEINYINRTDWFTDLDWNPNLRALGYIENTTHHIIDKQGQSIAKITEAIINKPQFYANKTLANLVDLPDLSPEEKAIKLLQLQNEGKKFTPISSQLSYLPLDVLFDKNGNPDLFIWDQLPECSIIESVRPGWRPVNPLDLAMDYGTQLNVSHMGIARRKENTVYFYHASRNTKCVVEVSLLDYFKDFLHSTMPNPVAGFHVERMIF